MSDILYNFVYNLLSFLPNLSLEIPEEVKTTFFDIIKGVTYFFPVRLCLPIIYSSLTILGVRMSLAIYKFIKSHIPFMG